MKEEQEVTTPEAREMLDELLEDGVVEDWEEELTSFYARFSLDPHQLEHDWQKGKVSNGKVARIYQAVKAIRNL